MSARLQDTEPLLVMPVLCFAVFKTKVVTRGHAAFLKHSEKLLHCKSMLQLAERATPLSDRQTPRRAEHTQSLRSQTEESLEKEDSGKHGSFTTRHR